MKRLDLIIDAIDYFLNSTDPVDCYKLTNALAAARELRALKPYTFIVGYIDKNGILVNNTTHPQLNTPLYALDEVKHD